MGSCETDQTRYRRILGIDFFFGSPKEAVAKMRSGGLLVVPAAPALKDLPTSADYRASLLGAEMAITDSAFMVMIWNLIRHDHVTRLSGLCYLRELLQEEDFRRPGNTMWILASPQSARNNLAWLGEQGIYVPDEAIHLAPMYGARVEDPDLIGKLKRLRPQHVIVTVGGGTQERLGMYMKQNLDYLPAIHCIGAAIAFLSGDQVRIPVWADRLYLGWIYRCFSEPRRYVPRYWDARKLFGLMLKYRSELPPLVG